MQYYISPPPMNPLSRLLAAVLAVLALAGAFFFGVFVLVIAIGLGLIGWLVLWLRMWWMRQKLAHSAERQGSGAAPGRQPGTGQSDRQGEIIDAEYTVVSKSEDS